MILGILPLVAGSPTFALVGAQVNPHVRASSMRYAHDPGPAEGALVKLFLRNRLAGNLFLGSLTFQGRTPANMLVSGEWSWHDTPSVRARADRVLPGESLTVLTMNTNRRGGWHGRQTVGLQNWLTGTSQEASIEIGSPKQWFSAINVLGSSALRPQRMLAWIENRGAGDLRVEGLRLWLPRPGGSPHHFFARTLSPAKATVPRGELGFVGIPLEGVEPGYGVVEAQTNQGSIWAHLRLRVERFDIGSGWPGGASDGRHALAQEPYLKLLKRWQVTSANIDFVPGYSDNPDLFGRYVVRTFNRMEKIADWDNDRMLDRVHGVEFLGEPQLDGMPPMDVLRAFRPYERSRLPTTLTHSDESTWRFYAGLSDFPHYDAYRVSAPSPDDFRRYERWGKPIGWGAPLETIGDMCVSLREMSRPAATAVWSQGPHDGWGRYDGRTRTSPTPDELRSQAYHALATRVTSLYWFNASLTSAAAWRDLLDPVERVGREIRVMEPVLVQGAAYRSHLSAAWHLRSVVGPDSALLFALDNDYRPDAATKTFVFPPARRHRFAFDLPTWLRGARTVVRFDADGARSIPFRSTPRGISFDDSVSVAAVYFVGLQPDLLRQVQERIEGLQREAAAVGFDPARSDEDFEVLRRLARR